MTRQISTEIALKEGLKAAGTSNAKEVLNNAELFAFMLGIFNETVKMSSGKSADVAIRFTSKVLSTTKIAGKSTDSKSLVVGTTAAQIMLSSASLILLAGKANPTVVYATIGATFAKKTSLAFGLAKDDKTAKCIAAAADVAAAGLGATAAYSAYAAAAAAAATGVGAGVAAVILAGSIAQIAVSGYQAHQACVAKK